MLLDLLSINKSKKKTHYDNKWVSVYKYKWNKPEGVCLKISPASYFDNRAHIVLCLGWVQFFISLPIYSDWDDCDYPEYGFYYHESNLVICYGMDKHKFIHMPWELDWYRTSKLRKDGAWEHEISKDKRRKFNHKDFEAQEAHEKEVLWSEDYPYIYNLKYGEVQNRIATVKVRECEHRPRWFKWTSLFSKISKYIDISFSDEVGEETGSWKGGTIGCNWDMLKCETPEQSLRRMEKERTF